MKKIVLIICVLALIAAMCLGCAACGLFKGKDAVGISSIEKTDTQGLVDTYTITMTDGTTSTFTVTNGQGTNQLPSDTYTPEHYFRFELLDDDTYAVRARYRDMYPTIVIPDSYKGKAVTKISDWSFCDCQGVDEMVVPESIVYFGEEWPSYNAIIRYRGTKAQWNAIEKNADWIGEGEIKLIHCADGDINLG